MKEDSIKYIDFLSKDEILKLVETDKKSFVGIIPKNVSSEDELMHVYFDKLNLAPYFGGNWDALDEVLVDFDWINAEKIIIVHLDIPQLNLENKKLLFSVLIEAVKKMRKGYIPGGFLLPTGKHKLQVIFPESNREEVQSILNSKI